MPFTPFHFGPSAALAIPLKKHIDLPIFVFANVIIDLEVLIIMLFKLNIPLHGHVHSFSIGSLVAIGFACMAYLIKPLLEQIMSIVQFPYETSFKKIVLSSLLGFWFHVLLDAPLYSDIRPFFPFDWNPFYGLISGKMMYFLCVVSFIPAAVLFFLTCRKSRDRTSVP